MKSGSEITIALVIIFGTAQSSAAKKNNVDLTKSIRVLINDESDEKCKGPFIDQKSIKQIKTNKGEIKLRDPWKFHVCCKSENCGNTVKLYSYDKDSVRGEGQCHLVQLRFICPEIQETLLKRHSHLNLFNTRNSCDNVCTPKSARPNGPSFYRNKYKPNELTNEPTFEKRDDYYDRKPHHDRIPIPRFDEMRPNPRHNSQGLIRGGNNYYIDQFKHFYSPPNELNTNEMMTNDVPAKTDRKDRCLLPKSEGSNKGPLKKATVWYYEANVDKCLTFKYKGSSGNHNRFYTHDSCIEQCKREVNEETDETSIPDTARDSVIDISGYDFSENQSENHDFCNDPVPDAWCGFGNIKAKFYYDKVENKCQVYISSGCQNCEANGCNSFKYAKDCKKACIEQ